MCIYIYKFSCENCIYYFVNYTYTVKYLLTYLCVYIYINSLVNCLIAYFTFINLKDV